jgi:hypothetical protein
MPPIHHTAPGVVTHQHSVCGCDALFGVQCQHALQQLHSLWRQLVPLAPLVKRVRTLAVVRRLHIRKAAA